MHRRASRASTSPQLSTLLGYQIDSDRLDRDSIDFDKENSEDLRAISGLMTQQHSAALGRAQRPGWLTADAK